jgi:hypothetical protein
MSKKEMSEKEINDAYKKLVDEYNEKEKKMTLSSTRTKFAMGVHEKMKKQQVEEILKKAGNIVKEINDSSGDNTELYEKFDDLIRDLIETHEYSYGGGKKRTMRKKNRKGTRTTTRTRRQRKNRTRAMRKKSRKSRK